jgi:hypothetical protein
MNSKTEWIDGEEVMVTEGKPLPEVILHMLREQFPRLLTADIDGKDVYLLMGDKRGRPKHAIHYIADHNFAIAVRVAESGPDNLAMLCGDGFQMKLLAPRGGTENE